MMTTLDVLCKTRGLVVSLRCTDGWWFAVTTRFKEGFTRTYTGNGETVEEACGYILDMLNTADLKLMTT